MHAIRGLEVKIHRRTSKCDQDTFLEKQVNLTLKSSMQQSMLKSVSNLIISEGQPASIGGNITGLRYMCCYLVKGPVPQQ